MSKQCFKPSSCSRNHYEGNERLSLWKWGESSEHLSMTMKKMEVRYTIGKIYHMVQ